MYQLILLSFIILFYQQKNNYFLYLNDKISFFQILITNNQLILQNNADLFLLFNKLISSFNSEFFFLLEIQILINLYTTEIIYI